ncbi:MAG: hypothetical protein R3F31_12175 [Verrucomicrobiales bacterium]
MKSPVFAGPEKAWVAVQSDDRLSRIEKGRDRSRPVIRKLAERYRSGDPHLPTLPVPGMFFEIGIYVATRD